MIRIVLIMFFISSCRVNLEEIYHKVDSLAFRKLGTTLFSSPKSVSMKEIHLQSVYLLGQKVIIEGQISYTLNFTFLTQIVEFDFQ